MDKTKNSYTSGVVFLVLIIALIVLLAVLIGRSGKSAASLGSKSVSSDEVTRGLQILRELEARDPALVEEEIKAIQQQELIAEREERIRQIESGEISVWTLYEDFVLLGDSRAVGFDFYGFLPDDRVLAESGERIDGIEGHLDQITALNPSNIFLCYGLNDILIGIWTTPEDYAADYEMYLEELHNHFPDAAIYVNGTLEATMPALSEHSILYQIPDYNAAVQSMCDTLDYVHFVDNSSLVADHPDLVEIDGIHLQKTFYPYWGENMMLEVYDIETGEDTNS